MKILGIAAPFGHDSSAALIIDGKVVAAVEEERFTRKKHAEGQLPANAIKYCLSHGGVCPSEIDAVAFPWSIKPLKEKRWQYFKRRIIKKPSKAYKKFFRNQKEFDSRKNFVRSVLEECGFNSQSVKIEWIEHQIAHVASSYFFSGMKDSALLSIDAGGEITCSMLGEVKDKKILKIKELLNTDSLGAFYSTMTDYLGFRRGYGEYKVMGMAPYGDASKVNFDRIIYWDDKRKIFKCNDDYVWVTRDKRHRVDKIYAERMIKEFAPEREGDDLVEPYTHIAAVTQKKLEEMTLKLVDAHLKDVIQKHGNLCFAGGVALNVALNRILLELPYLRRLWVQPAAHDSGTSLGAAAYVAHKLGEKILPMDDVYLGPEFNNEEIESELKQWEFPFAREKDICAIVAELLNKGEVAGWFQGRMEWGPRALGNRSILGNPTVRGTADKINAIIKFREQWRPFCPSILKEKAAEILDSSHPAPFMTIAFKMNSSWAKKVPEVVHVDGTCRPQVVENKINPKFHKLIDNFYKRTGVPIVINTSLNRRGEPVVCTPKDAMSMFKGSGLSYLAIGDFLVRKKKQQG